MIAQTKSIVEISNGSLNIRAIITAFDDWLDVVGMLRPKDGYHLSSSSNNNNNNDDDEDVEDANWWESWGSEFKEKMPQPIEQKVNAILTKTGNDPDAKKRIAERLDKIKSLAVFFTTFFSSAKMWRFLSEFFLDKV